MLSECAPANGDPLCSLSTSIERTTPAHTLPKPEASEEQRAMNTHTHTHTIRPSPTRSTLRCRIDDETSIGWSCLCAPLRISMHRDTIELFFGLFATACFQASMSATWLGFMKPRLQDVRTDEGIRRRTSRRLSSERSRKCQSSPTSVCVCVVNSGAQHDTMAAVICAAAIAGDALVVVVAALRALPTPAPVRMRSALSTAL